MKTRLLLALAIVLVVALGVAVARRHRRPHVDMVAKLAELAAREGVWDNPWDKSREKIRGSSAGARHRARSTQPLHAGAGDRRAGRVRGRRRPGDLHAGGAAARARSRHASRRSRGGQGGSGLCPAPARRDRELRRAPHPGLLHLPHRGRGGAQAEGRVEPRRWSSTASCSPIPATSPENALSYRWLMNIGHMTLGTYPDGVPAKWLIPPEAFRSDADIGRFPDVAAARGVVEFGAAGGLILEDFDNDGHLDMLISHMGIDRPAGVLPQRWGRSLHPAHRGGGAEGHGRRAGHVPGRLRQRRLHRRLHPPRRVAPRRGQDPAVAAPQQLQRDVHRRHLPGRAAEPSCPRRRRPGRTSTTTGSSTSSSATRSARRSSGRRERSTSSST